MPLCEKCQRELKRDVNYSAVYQELNSQLNILNKTLSKACDAGMEVDLGFIDTTELGDNARRIAVFIRSASVSFSLCDPNIRHSDKIPGVKG